MRIIRLLGLVGLVGLLGFKVCRVVTRKPIFFCDNAASSSSQEGDDL